MRLQLSLPTVIAALALATPAYALSPNAEQATRQLFNPSLISDVAERVSPAVVSIATKANVEARFRHERMRGPEMGMGSGVIISEDGFIVTNNHVVARAGDVRVRLNDGRELPAKLIGADAPADIALIKVEAKGLPFMKFGDSSKLRLGEFVLAVGNPFGVGQTVTMGIVSAKGRSNMGIVDYEDFIQTDAAINPGNSGGALVNLDGTLVGINTAILSRTGGAAGIGFAVPSNMVRPLIDQIQKTGHVSRGWLGVGIQDLTADLAKGLDIKESSGVVISDVLKDGPADKAGMEVGDVVVSIDGRTISSASELRNTVAMIAPGSKTKIIVKREGSTKELSVRLDQKKDQPGTLERETFGGESGESGAWSGIELQPMTRELRARLEAPREVDGVVVTDIDPTSVAAEAGLRPGDVIVGANRRPVKSLDDLRPLAKKDDILLRVWRGGSYIFVVIGK